MRISIFRNERQYSEGFTLVEIIVVVTIFAALAATLLVSQQQARRSSNIRIAADSTQSALRLMQNQVLSGERYSPSSAARDHGIKLSSGGTAYETFVEEAGTVSYKSLETYTFPASVAISNLQVTSGGSTQSATLVEIRFFPPFGEVRVTAKNGGTTLFTEQKNVIVVFRFVYSGASQYRQLTVDGVSGRISEF